MHRRSCMAAGRRGAADCSAEARPHHVVAQSSTRARGTAQDATPRHLSQHHTKPPKSPSSLTYDWHGRCSGYNYKVKESDPVSTEHPLHTRKAPSSPLCAAASLPQTCVTEQLGALRTCAVNGFLASLARKRGLLSRRQGCSACCCVAQSVFAALSTSNQPLLASARLGVRLARCQAPQKRCARVMPAQCQQEM